MTVFALSKSKACITCYVKEQLSSVAVLLVLSVWELFVFLKSNQAKLPEATKAKKTKRDLQK